MVNENSAEISEQDEKEDVAVETLAEESKVIEQEKDNVAENETEETELEEKTDLATASTTASGTCGSNLTWTLDANGKMVISGTGAIYVEAFEGNENIVSVSIEEE